MAYVSTTTDYVDLAPSPDRTFLTLCAGSLRARPSTAMGVNGRKPGPRRAARAAISASAGSSGTR